MNSQAIVYIVDDDEAVRHSLGLLLQSVGLTTLSFSSASSFLDGYDAAQPGCLILDVRMPDMSGLDLQQVLSDKGINIPTIIITGHGDIPLAVRAMKAGAMDVIEKPFNDQTLLDSINKAVLVSRDLHQQQLNKASFNQLIGHLSPREHDVLHLLVEGKNSKEIASQLGISPKTVDVHRTHVMEKMRVRTVVQLARMVVSTYQ